MPKRGRFSKRSKAILSLRRDRELRKKEFGTQSSSGMGLAKPEHSKTILGHVIYHTSEGERPSGHVGQGRNSCQAREDKRNARIRPSNKIRIREKPRKPINRRGC